MSKNSTKSMKEVKCYASALGNCSDVQSIEHYISRSFFTNNMLMVEGLEWLNGEAKKISYKKLGLKILCEYHNNLLSPVDSAVSGIGHKIEDLSAKQNERSNLPRSAMWKKGILEINGFVFEQWMIKVALGGMFENKTLRWHQHNLEALNPPIEILESLFGLKKLENPMGIYLAMGIGERVLNEQRAGICHLQHRETKGYVGAMINFRNFQFLMYFHDEPNLGIFESWNGTTFGNGKNEPMYRPLQFNLTTKGKISSIINFNWEVEPIKLL